MNPVVIVPFHDPDWLPNVEANLARQTVEARVVFAINGKAAGFESARWQTTPSGESHAGAVNAGVEWARVEWRGFSHAVLMDSDDYYGPGYLAQALEALSCADYIGKRAVYTWLSDGLHLFDRKGGAFLGGTIGFDLSKFVDMPAVLQDDTEWCARMSSAGNVGKDTGSSEFCYVRHGSNGHWKANDVIVRRAWGEAQYFPAGCLSDVSRDPGPCVARPMPSDSEVFNAL